MSSQRRASEFRKFPLLAPSGYSLFINDDDATRCVVYFPGPIDSPYQSGRFRLQVQFTDDFPFRPPQIRMSTRVFSPYISADGAVCGDVFGESWSPACSLLSMVLSVASRLSETTLDAADPINPEAARLFVDDRERFNDTAREWTRLYATPRAPLGLSVEVLHPLAGDDAVPRVRVRIDCPHRCVPRLQLSVVCSSDFGVCALVEENVTAVLSTDGTLYEAELPCPVNKVCCVHANPVQDGRDWDDDAGSQILVERALSQSFYHLTPIAAWVRGTLGDWDVDVCMLHDIQQYVTATHPEVSDADDTLAVLTADELNTLLRSFPRLTEARSRKLAGGVHAAREQQQRWCGGLRRLWIQQCSDALVEDGSSAVVSDSSPLLSHILIDAVRIRSFGAPDRPFLLAAEMSCMVALFL